MSKMYQAKNSWAQASAGKKTGLSCLGCLGCGGIGFVFLIVVALIGAIVSPSKNTDTSAVASTASVSASVTPSATASPSPSEEAVALEKELDVQAIPASDTKVGPTAQAALDLLNTLEVKGRAEKTGYDRALFGQSWADTDRNGCDTRNDILRRDLTEIKVKPGTNGCKVLSGVLKDPYTGKTISFTQGKDSSNAVQIDHVVSLSDSWQTGAKDWDSVKREKFANDPANLLAVDGPANEQKGDSDAASWLPANKDYRCTYISKQIDVKAKYGLWVKQAEKDAMIQVLEKCGAKATPKPSPTPSTESPAKKEESAPVREEAPVVKEEPAPVVEEAQPEPVVEEPVPAQPAPLYQPPAEPAPAAVYYKNCSAAKAAGAAPIYAGQPGYGSHLDRDGDGVACEK
ncbi:GmrSD restriction endonuclease domain-containing protein [Rothia sp. CCM 9417]|uniref:GmrSD restriction endonuclease domain-containing protein n=1 Tax=Rothia sp. CCM 9417 TaxID=3402657 RepID=UPI003AECEAAE